MRITKTQRERERIEKQKERSVVVGAQLAEWILPTPEVRGLIPEPLAIFG